MDFVANLATSILASIVTASGFVWLAKTAISERLKNAIKSEYDQKLETHKAQLKAQSDVEIERLKSALSISAAQRNLQFSKLHEQRAIIIAEAYSKLKSLYKALGDYTASFEPAGGPSRDERRKAAAVAFNELRDYIDTKTIFIPKTTSSKIDAIRIEFGTVYYDFLYKVDVLIEPGRMKTWTDISNKIEGDIRVALTELEDEFRILLGDDSLEALEPANVPIQE